MNNEKVIALPASTNYTPEQALLSALEFCRDDNLTDVLVIGYDADGGLVVRSSKMTRAEGLFMAEKARMWAITGDTE
jgi:hypothetical protein